MTRPGWSDYFLSIAAAVAQRADCRRRKVGAVLVDADHRIVATGYNGTLAGAPGCLDGACPRGMLTYDQVAEFSDYSTPGAGGYCISTHAEVNALLGAQRPLAGLTLYITDSPCSACWKAISNAGVSWVVA